MSGEAMGKTGTAMKRQIKISVSSNIAVAVRILAREDRLRGRYITANALSQVIEKRYMFVDDLDFNVEELNRAMVVHFPQIDSENGSDGFYRLKRMIRFLGEREEQKRARVIFYYFTSKGKPIGEIPEKTIDVAA